MFFLDTDICVFALRGTFPVLHEHIQRTPPGLIKLSSVVLAELSFGASKAGTISAQKAVEFLVQPFEVVPFDRLAAEVYGDLRLELERKGRMIGPNDLMIAATVISRRGILVTHNTKEFARVPGLKIQDWTK